MSSTKIFGTFIDAPSLGDVRILHDYCLTINKAGFIQLFEYGTFDALAEVIDTDTQVIHIPKGSFLLPSFCDLHLHAPQFLYQGTGLHLPLMEWLDQYTYKAEERIDSDPDLARRTYTALAKRLKEHGTGAVLLFGTIKVETNLLLADIMRDAGLRAYVGKLSMDISSRKTYVESSKEAALDAARFFLNKFSEKPNASDLVEPVITPRFVPTCSDELLTDLGQLAKEKNSRIQSHLAEARDQVNWVEQERRVADIDVFDKHNLLTPRTVQAHCTFLTPTCFHRLSDRGTSIAHCPLSNAYFSEKPFALREALDAGVPVGLGTDVAGGYSIDIMNSMRSAVMVSRMREGELKEHVQANKLAKEKTLSINWKESLYLATRGGAIALSLPEDAGVFEVGAPFDAQLISLYNPADGQGVGPLDFLDRPDPRIPVNEELLERWWSIGDRQNRSAVWVQGRQIYP